MKTKEKETPFQSKYSDPAVQEVESLFRQVVGFYIPNLDLIDGLFAKVYKKYTAKNRHYHDINHIYNMCCLWNQEKHRLKDPREIFLAIIYHDIIYVSRRSDNEEKSATYFSKHVNRTLGLRHDSFDKVINAILATKHNADAEKFWKKDKDIQFLLDFDLSILGADEESYEVYRKNVRKEYKIYPDVLYKPGRKKVLESFLKREKIFITPEYNQVFEKRARKNLETEINSYLC